MIRILSILFLTTIFNSVYSQTVTPVPTGEFCPNTEYTFTVTIPKTFQSIIGNAGCFVTLQPSAPVGSTFTFKGKFGDANQKQWFRINYTDATFYDIEFKKIKSLFFSSISTAFPPCNLIKPNQIQPVVFPPCQVSTATISFPNIQWFTTFETPEICFGTVTDYEYQLPANWKIGTFTSTGSNWYASGNSVVVTSDLSTGDGADIRIRASNKTCGTGLAANGPISTVRISRPKPVLTFSGNSVICSSQNFQASNVPAWVTNFLWEVTPVSVATVINPNSNPATVQKQSDGFANIKLTISNPSCGSYEYNTTEILNKPEIVVGTPAISGSYLNPNFSGGVLQSGQSVCAGTIRVSINEVQATTYSWQRVYGSAPFIDNGGYIDITLAPNENVSFQVTATSSCGSTGRTLNFIADDPQCGSGGGFFRFSVSPNPVKGNMNVVFDKPVKENENIIMRLYTINNFTIVKQWKLKGGQKQYILNKSDVKSGHYILEAAMGNSKVSKQVIIE